MNSFIRKSIVPAKGFTQRSLSNAAFSFQKGAKVGLMGTNSARSDVLSAIEKDNSEAVRLSSVPKDANSFTISTYLQKNVPEGSDINKVLATAGLSTGAQISSLSPGERSRLQLALASIQAPELLLVDQPTASPSADPMTLDDIKALSELINNYPKTCVVNSSDSAFLDTFSNSVVHISPDGNAEQLQGSYSSAQDVLAARYQAASGPAVVRMSLKEKAGLFALLLPHEVLIFWTLTYLGR